jgi:glycosyltransferase involved in cell wall biosynthesis
MKFCILTHNVIKGDGQGRANYEITLEAIRRGHSITLVAGKVAPEILQYSQIKWINIPVENYPTQLIKGIISSWRSTSWLRKNRHSFDLVQIDGAHVIESSDVNVAHFVHSSWLKSPIHPSRQLNVQGVYQWLYSFSNTYQEKKAFHKATIVVAVSQKIKQELIAIGIPSDRIHIILDGVDTEEFYPGKYDRQQLNLPEKVMLALFVGDICSTRKNLSTVLHALIQVPDLHLAVVGNTKRSPYPLLATTLGLSDRVHFLGYRSDVSEIMKAADLFVFPSHYEPFGMVVSEAMAAGLPVITTASVGAAEIITPDCGIVLSEPDNIEALVVALKNLIGSDEMRINMGKAGRIIASQHSWESKAKSYLDLFEELTQK